ncbi:MAG: tetratricopeptide repeat protein [Deltaproteobacteria bacterium]|nr:tetratricopeptide repeat protein [Deltaproteobacteria bacterium]
MSAPQKKKFQGWELTPRGKIVGVWPLPDQLEPDDCVEVEVDAAGNVTCIREWLDGGKHPVVRRPFYKAGRLDRSEYEDPTTGLCGCNHYEYDGRGLLSARQEVAPNGKVRHRIEVRCDDQGRFAEEKVHDARGRVVEQHRYMYDDAGRLVRDEELLLPAGKALKGFHALTYDARGRIARRAWHDPAGRELSSFRYAYDALDRRVEMTVESSGKAQVTRRVVFDEKGHSKDTALVDAAGRPVVVDGKVSTGVEAKGGTPSPDRLLREGSATLGQLTRMDTRQVEAVCHQAYAHFESGRFAEARALFESLATLDPRCAYYLAGVAAAAMQEGDVAAALNWYDRALTHAPGHLPSLVGRAEALLRKGDVDASLQAFQQVLLHAPAADDPVVQRTRALMTALAQGVAPAPGRGGH